ncbi:MAG TPA: PAS domain S-box protein, partial [Terriglobales bacterium]
RVKRGEQIHSYETERIRKDGTRIIMAVAVAPIRDSGGNLLGASTIARDITEQKRAEEEIKRASLYARSLIEASVDPLVTISKAGKIMDVNRGTELATGLTREQLIGTDFSDYFTEPEKARAGYERVFAEETVHDYPLALRHRSGKIMEVVYNASVFRVERGEVEGVFAAARDVTKLNQALEEVKRASLYARSLIEASVDPLVTISKAGKIMDVNRATEQATGCTREQLIGTDFSDYFTEPEKARAGYERVFAEETVHDYPLALRHRSGQVMEVLYSASVFRNQRGGVEGVFAAARDVSERNQAERALKLSEIRYRSLVTATSQIVWSTDASGKVVSDMPLWRSYTGTKVEQIMGGGWIDSLHPDDRERTADIWIRAVRDHSLYDTEYRIRRHDGEYRIFSVRGVPVPDDSGGIREWIGTCTDITERKQAEEALHRLNEELESRVQQRTAQLQAANQELESFTYSVSHDLRAPLRHISGFSKILSEDFSAGLPQEAQHLLQRIDEGTRRMGMLVDDLLNLGRVGRHEVRLQVTGLDTVVKEVLIDLQPESENRQVEWKIGRLPYVECDAPLMKQVFQNLLSNALKFTRPREHVVIEVGTQEQNGVPVVFVRDNGVGFSMKYADKLFGVFQRLHRTEDFEGTGVGLATVQRIIQKHGGRIWAEADLDKGATFYFTLNASESVPGKPTSQQEKNHESTRS